MHAMPLWSQPVQVIKKRQEPSDSDHLAHPSPATAAAPSSASPTPPPPRPSARLVIRARHIQDRLEVRVLVVCLVVRGAIPPKKNFVSVALSKWIQQVGSQLQKGVCAWGWGLTFGRWWFGSSSGPA